MSRQTILRSITEENLKSDVPAIRPGDTVRAHTKVREAGKERIQLFEGICVAVKGGGIAKSVVLRKISSGIGVERSFPMHSPNVEKFEIVRKGSVRRAKLYYLRTKVGRESRIKEKR